MRFEVTWHPEVESDLRGLGDDEVVKRALAPMLSLREEPRVGNQLRERYNMRVLGGCRSIRFDRTGWQGRPRYRLVFENQPSDGAPHEARVYAVAPREKLEAYTRAARRLGEERRQQDPRPRRR